MSGFGHPDIINSSNFSSVTLPVAFELRPIEKVYVQLQLWSNADVAWNERNLIAIL